MKKFLVFLICIICALSFSGCGKSNATQEGDNSDSQGNGNTQTPDSDHTHSWDWTYTEESHLQVCDICEQTQNAGAHSFDEKGECECGFVYVPVKDYDTKNYYVVGSFTSWETAYREDMAFTRLWSQDKDGFTLYTKQIALNGGDEFKIVNDGDPSQYYSNEMNFSALKGGNASDFFYREGNHANIGLSDGYDNTYLITLHTDPEAPLESYFTIDIYDPSTAPEIPEEDFGEDIYEFGDEISKLNNDFYKDYSEEEKELYYTLWKETTTVSIKVDIEPYELAKINEAFKSGDVVKQETYRKCNLTVTVNGTEYYFEEVGIRMRGNTSRRDFCDESGNIYAYVHYRFSVSETFDGEEYENGAWGSEIAHDWSNDATGRKERKNRSFATMEKFYYKWNKNYDQTYIREIYANRMFQSYGILAPHITLTQISIKQNGNFESLGVGNLYETVDKQFIKRNFSKADKGGDLYKCTYAMGPADLTSAKNYGIGDEYTYSLKTNDDPEDKDFNNHRYLLAFIEALGENDRTLFAEKLESMMDMHYFTRFEAVNYAAGNPDCIRNNFNNYYLYFTPAGKAYIIPYDYDRCFGINKDWNPSGNGMTQAGPYDTKSYGSNCTNPNPLYAKTILSGGIAKYKKLYQSKLRLVLDGVWMTYGNFLSIYNAYKENYDSLTTPSSLIIGSCGGSVDMSRLDFSESGTDNFGSTNHNISTSDYLEIKRQTLAKAIDRV